jgi:hypothetical protein
VDFVIELLVGLVVQFVSELIGELMMAAAVQGAAHAIHSRVGRYGLTAVFGLAIGAIWGFSLRDEHHVPRLLWVSLAFAGLAAILRIVDVPGREVSPGLGWRQALTVPWRWSKERLIGLMFLNVAMAAGVLLGYQGQ